MIRLYLAGAVAAVVLALGGAAWFGWNKVSELRREITLIKLELGACESRTNALLRAKERSDEIDRIPDNDLRHVPDGWLFTPGAGGLY